MKKEPELARRIGNRLKNLRLEVGLTQGQVAERMGIKGRYRKHVIYQVESGQGGCPTVRTIARYLRACGARWSRLSDILEHVEPVSVDTRPIEASRLSEKTKRQLRKLTEDQVDKYHRRLAYPIGKQALPPMQQAAMAHRLGRYRAAVNVIEQMVNEYLRTQPVLGADYAKYKVVARQVLGRLWQQSRLKGAALRVGTRAAGSGRDRFRQPAMAQSLGSGIDRRIARQVQRLVVRQFSKLDAVSRTRGTHRG